MFQNNCLGKVYFSTGWKVDVSFTAVVGEFLATQDNVARLPNVGPKGGGRVGSEFLQVAALVRALGCTVGELQKRFKSYGMAGEIGG